MTKAYSAEEPPPINQPIYLIEKIRLSTEDNESKHDKYIEEKFIELLNWFKDNIPSNLYIDEGSNKKEILFNDEIKAKYVQWTKVLTFKEKENE